MRLVRIHQISLLDGTMVNVYHNGDFESQHTFPAVLDHIKMKRKALLKRREEINDEIYRLEDCIRDIENREKEDEVIAP